MTAHVCLSASALFLQPMSFRHYPFDSFDLLIELRFFGGCH